MSQVVNLRVYGQKDALIPMLWDESIQCFRGATQIQEAMCLSFEASCYGEDAVGISAPALPLSFHRSGRNALNQGVPLCKAG